MKRYYGWFSQKAADSHGAVCYRSINGKDIWTTMIQIDDPVLDSEGYLWEDVKYVGEITMEEVGRCGPNSNYEILKNTQFKRLLKDLPTEINVLGYNPLMKKDFSSLKLEKSFNEKINLNHPKDDSSEDD